MDLVYSWSPESLPKYISGHAPNSGAIPFEICKISQRGCPMRLAVFDRLRAVFAVEIPPTPAERLAATLKPRPDLRDRRFATWGMDRREQYLAASYGTPHSLLRRAKGLTAQSPNFPVSALPPVVADTGLLSKGQFNEYCE
jgi:hypothetical protein